MNEYYAVNLSPDELVHHGIKGMHWGIRRYQNEDGTLTEAGKKQYSKHLDKITDELSRDTGWTIKRETLKSIADSKLKKAVDSTIKNNRLRDYSDINKKIHKQLDDLVEFDIANNLFDGHYDKSLSRSEKEVFSDYVNTYFPSRIDLKDH